MPTMNPDGFEYEYKQEKHALGPGRFNAHQIDLNRNFPKIELQPLADKTDLAIPKADIDNEEIHLDQFNDSKLFEPEVRAVMHWSLVYPFVLSANLHGGALVANYPYDNQVKDPSMKGSSKSPDDQTFRMLAKAYSHVMSSLE